MVSVSKDPEGRVIGWIEWRQVGQSGFDKWLGEYVWINDFWIHSQYRGTGIVFKELVEKVLISAKGSKWAYFTRSKYHGRKSKLYTRQDFETLVGKANQWAAIQ